MTHRGEKVFRRFRPPQHSSKRLRESGGRREGASTEGSGAAGGLLEAGDELGQGQPDGVEHLAEFQKV